MAHQSPIVPTKKHRTEPVAWPSSQHPQAVRAQGTAAAGAKDLYTTSVGAAQRSLRDAQQKLSWTATSLVDAVRTFANERPLHLIAIVAGASLVAGVALRIWRAKRYA